MFFFSIARPFHVECASGRVSELLVSRVLPPSSVSLPPACYAIKFFPAFHAARADMFLTHSLLPHKQLLPDVPFSGPAASPAPPTPTGIASHLSAFTLRHSSTTRRQSCPTTTTVINLRRSTARTPAHLIRPLNPFIQPHQSINNILFIISL